MMNIDFDVFCEMNNIRIRVQQLPFSVRGMAFYYHDVYIVIINNRCSHMQQELSTVHEMIHILENHFHCGNIDNENCEKDVERIIRNLKNSPYHFLH